jgi:hypothetical protein
MFLLVSFLTLLHAHAEASAPPLSTFAYKGSGFFRNTFMSPETKTCTVEIDQWSADIAPNPGNLVGLYFEPNFTCCSALDNTCLSQSSLMLLTWNPEQQLVDQTGNVIGRISFQPDGKISLVDIRSTSNFFLFKQVKDGWRLYETANGEDGNLVSEAGATLK